MIQMNEYYFSKFQGKKGKVFNIPGTEIRILYRPLNFVSKIEKNNNSLTRKNQQK